MRHNYHTTTVLSSGLFAQEGGAMIVIVVLLFTYRARVSTKSLPRSFHSSSSQGSRPTHGPCSGCYYATSLQPHRLATSERQTFYLFDPALEVQTPRTYSRVQGKRIIVSRAFFLAKLPTTRAHRPPFHAHSPVTTIKKFTASPLSHHASGCVPFVWRFAMAFVA